MIGIILQRLFLPSFVPPSPIQELRNSFRGTEVETMEVRGRLLGEVVEDWARQVAARSPAKLDIRVLFSPESLQKQEQVVFGNPPIAGMAEEAMFRITSTYGCRYSLVNEDTVLIYKTHGNGKVYPAP